MASRAQFSYRAMRGMRCAIMVLLMFTTTHAALRMSEACPSESAGPADSLSRRTLLESASHGPIVLRPEGTHSVLRPSQGPAGISPGEVLRLAVASRRLILLLCDLRAAETPETLFHVYLNLPEHADQSTRAHHSLAQLNFFTALRSGDTTMPVWQSFDITQTVVALAEQGMLKTDATLTILAAQRFDAQSRPSVGRIAIVQQ